MKASRTFKYGAHDVTIETGAIARQADGAVLVNMADTVVLVTAVGDKKDVAGRDFFPLTVNYQEKTFAAGKIPGGFFKREGRPSEKETLTSRLIDRPIRPLFPDGYRRDVQVIATVLSMNTEIDPDIPSLIGASAALMLSGLPFMGPIGAARVGYKDGQYLLNPTRSELQQSKLDLVVAGTQDAVLMVESQADRLSEDVMLGAVMFGHEQMQIAIEAIRSLAKEAGRPPVVWTPPVEDTALVAGVAKFVPAITEAYGIPEKLVRYGKISELKKQCVAELTAREGNTWTPAQIDAAFHDTEYKVVRGRIMAGKPRIDGRDTKTVRKIDVQVGILPRTHGSAVFTRGETQALVVTTLGTGR
ncbi:MAG TPA: polyribonucleotide nucleotidyltransferase, partial [Gammaproteobacteria bacterium]|nr:polyribonucleotide nucleotidyltransferase [Gammaproteobacteria bacterium]